MRFYNRKEELALLAQLFSREGADLVLVSGRRRIGKSRLIEEFAKDKNAISVMVVPKEEKQVAMDIAEELRKKRGYSPSFQSFREALEYLFEQNVELVILDEFPNVLSVNASIPFEFQKVWDKYQNTKNVLFIVSGSYTGMMNRLFTAKKAPLFNRATHTLNISYLPFGTVVSMLGDMGIFNPVEQISYYCVFGGVPYYYVLIEKDSRKSFDETIRALFFNPGAQLREEGENILRQEFGNAYSKYYAILEAIHAGRVTMNEIAQKLGLRSTTLAKYMGSLQREFKLIERIVPFGENLFRSKKGLYFIRDNTLSFWFALVFGKSTTPSSEDFSLFMGKRFELFCSQFLSDFLAKRGEKVLKVEKWWGQIQGDESKWESREIDIVIETDKTVYLGECKWSNSKVGEKELLRLQESAKGIQKTRKPFSWVLFSKSGFTINESKNLLLFDSLRIVKEAK